MGNPRGFEPSNCQSESTLDVEQILGLAGGATQMYFGGAGWIYEWSQDYLGLSPADSPDIVSLSYGWAEEGQLNQCQIAQQECSQLGVNSTGYVVRTCGYKRRRAEQCRARDAHLPCLLALGPRRRVD